MIPSATAHKHCSPTKRFLSQLIQVVTIQRILIGRRCLRFGVSFATYGALTAGFLLLSGCLMTREGVQQAEQKKQMTDQFQNIQKTQAENMNQQNEILEQQRKLLGRLETLEAAEASRMKEQQAQKEQAAEKERLAKEELSALRDELAQVKSAVSALAGAGAAAASGSASATEGGGPLQAANEAFSAQEWRKAVLLYQKFRDKNPKSKWMPEATYKMGVAFVELGMKEEAGELFKEIVSKFPKSDYHSKAKAALRKLKM